MQKRIQYYLNNEFAEDKENKIEDDDLSQSSGATIYEIRNLCQLEESESNSFILFKPNQE